MSFARGSCATSPRVRTLNSPISASLRERGDLTAQIPGFVVTFLESVWKKQR